MTDIENLQEEIAWLTSEIRGLKSRIGQTGNAVQFHKLEMMERLLARCNRALKNMQERAA